MRNRYFFISYSAVLDDGRTEHGNLYLEAPQFPANKMIKQFLADQNNIPPEHLHIQNLFEFQSEEDFKNFSAE